MDSSKSELEVEPLLERVMNGAAVGGAFTVFMVLPLIMIPFTGLETTMRGQPVHLGWLIVTYPLGATLWGVLLSVGLPLVPSTPLAAIWGAISMAPWTVGVALSVDHGYLDWTYIHTITASIGAVLLGGFVGAMWYHIGVFDSPHPKRRGKRRSA